MQITSSYFRAAVGGSLQLIADPIAATPPLALNPFHLVHPDGRRLTTLWVGPVLCPHVEPQRVRMCAWGWNGHLWRLLHDGVELRAQAAVGAYRGDSVALPVPLGSAQAPAEWYSALCVIPRPSAVLDGAYEVRIGATDAPRWPC